MFTTLDLIPPLQTEVLTVTALPSRGAGWYGHTNGLHTVSIKVANFTGRVNIQASIAAVPQDSDWFNVLPDDLPYIQYPQPGYVVVSPQTGETSTYGFSFTANAVWVRATMDKSYFLPSMSTPMYIAMFGFVEYAKMSYGTNLGEFQYRRGWEPSPTPNKITGPQPPY